MGRRIAATITGLILLAGFGAGGYIVGHDPAKRNNASAENKARASGEADGLGKGLQQGEQAGYARGYAAGTQKTNSLLEQGAANSYTQGAKSVFTGFSSAWVPDTYYIIKLQPGSGGAPFLIESRLQMDAADYYNICPSNGQLCGDTWSDLTANMTAAVTSGGTPTTPSVAPSTSPDLSSGIGANDLPTYPVICTDGTVSYSGGHSGACSHHHGIG